MGGSKGSAQGRELTVPEQKSISTVVSSQKDKEKISVAALKLVKKKNKLLKDGEILITVGTFRIYLFKTGGKSPKSFHLLEVTKIVTSSDTEFELFTHGSTTPIIIASVSVMKILKHFCSSWSETFPGVTPLLEITPKERLSELWKKKKKLGVCYNLLKTYASLCNYLRTQPKQETIWIIQNVIAEQSIRTFDPNMFTFKELIDFKAVILSLRYNRWFRVLSLSKLKLAKESVISICEALRTNSSLQELNLENVKVPGPESFTGIFEAINSNSKKLNLTSITAADCEFEEKTASSIARLLANNSQLETLSIKNCGLTKKGFQAIFNQLERSSALHGTLKNLNFSNTKIEGSQTHKALLNTLKNCCALKTINLTNSGTFKTLDTLSQTTSPLTELNLKGIKFATPNINQDLIDIVKSTANTLEVLNLSQTPVSVNVCGELVNIGTKIRSLDISNNDYGDKGVSALFQLLASSPSLQELNINGNLTTHGKSKTRSDLLRGFNDFINGGEGKTQSKVKILHITAGKKNANLLKSEIFPIFKALARNTTITSLDLSGHSFGDSGAEELARCLSVNKTLRSLNVDENNIGLVGFKHLLLGLQNNSTLTHLEMPFTDILSCAKSSDKPKILQKYLLDIQAQVEKNCHKPNNPGMDLIDLLSPEQREAIAKELLSIGKIHNLEMDETRLGYLLGKALGKDTFEKFQQSAKNLAKEHIFELIMNDFKELNSPNSLPETRRRTVEDIRGTLMRQNTSHLLLYEPQAYSQMEIEVGDNPPKYQEVNKMISKNEQQNLLQAVPQTKAEKKKALTRKESKDVMGSFERVQSIVGPPSYASVYGNETQADPIKINFNDKGVGIQSDSDSSDQSSGEDEGPLAASVYEATPTSPKPSKIEIASDDDDDDDDSDHSRDARDEFEESLKLLEGEVIDFPAPPPDKIDPDEMPQQSGSSLFDLAHL